MPSDSRAGRPTALLGSAKINLRHLRVDLPADRRNGRLGEDKKNVARLIERFEQTKCRPQDPKNRVPILIEQSKLENLLRLNNLELTDLQRLPLPFLKEIPQDSGLLCLHGYHRLEAGRRHLFPGEDWWGVNIFSKEGTSEALEAQLRKSDNSAKPYDDGTVFYHARICDKDGDMRSAREWLAELPPSKLRDYRQLQRQPMLKHLRQAWDDLLIIPGIWNVLELGTWHRMLPMRCPEEQTCYLSMMLSQFRTVFQDNPEQIAHLDNGSAAILQGRSPCFSLEDTAHVQKASQDNELFANLPLSKRSKALLRVRQYDRMFLSIYTFNQDLKFLEAGIKPMAALLPRTWKGTIRQGFYKHFLYDSLAKQTREVGDDEYVELSHPTKQAAFSDAYRILCLHSFRNFPYLSDLKPRQTKRDPDLKLDRKRNRTECWVRFAKLAQRECFSTPTIERLSAEDANLAVAADALKCAKPSSYYHAADLVESQSQNLAGALKEVQEIKMSKATPELTADSFQTWRLSMRCGRPFDQAFQWIERYAYLENVYTEIVPHQRQAITHFAVFRDTFHAFFGRSLHVILQPLKEEIEDLSNVSTSPACDYATVSDLFPESWVSRIDSNVVMTNTSTEPTDTPGTDQSRSGEAQRDTERLASEQKLRDKYQAEAEARIKSISEHAALDAQKATAAAQRAQAERTASEQRLKDQADAERAAGNARIKSISDRAALDAQKAIAAAQRAQTERTASEQRLKDQANAERLKINARIKQISDDADASTAALQKATNDAAVAEREKSAAESQYRQLSDQMATETAQRTLARTDEALDVANSLATPEDDILRIPPAPQPDLAVSDAQTRRRNRTPLTDTSKRQDLSLITKKRPAESLGWNGIPRLTPPKLKIWGGSLTDVFLQIRPGKATLPSILKNYGHYSTDQKQYAKCLIRCLPDDEADDTDVFFFAESVHGKARYCDLVEVLKTQKPPYVFFELFQDNMQTKFVTSSNSIWDTRMIIAKRVNGRSFVKHPQGKYNVSLWPHWNQTDGFVFSEQLRLIPQPPTDPAQLQLTSQPSTDPAQLQLTSQPSTDPAQLQLTLQPSTDPAQLQLTLQPSTDPAQLQLTLQPSTDPAQLQLTSQPPTESTELRDSVNLQREIAKKLRRGTKLEKGPEKQAKNTLIGLQVIKQKSNVMKASKSRRKKRPGQPSTSNDAEMEDDENAETEDDENAEMEDDENAEMEDDEDLDVGEHENIEVNATAGKGYLAGALSKLTRW